MKSLIYRYCVKVYIGYATLNHASSKDRQTVVTLDGNLGVLDSDHAQWDNCRHRELVVVAEQNFEAADSEEGITPASLSNDELSMVSEYIV